MKPKYPPFEEAPLADTSVKTGNDMSYGDAKEEPRADKDEDLKDGDDKSSPLAKPTTQKPDKDKRPGYRKPGAPGGEA